MFSRRRNREIEVREGELIEVDLSDGLGVERRAHGEFVGPRGELASYALGWISTDEPRVARISVGIGRGNPGGGTFNAVVVPHDDSHGFALVDEPFESLPQGGPHLRADDARAHEDLPFVWAVVGAVMERDRRAAWMLHWLHGTVAIVTGEVAARAEPVLLAVRDEDGDWQMIGQTNADPATGAVEHLHHLIDQDRTLLDVLDLDRGEGATRARPGSAWSRSSLAEI